jgi:hypothetical protein
MVYLWCIKCQFYQQNSINVLLRNFCYKIVCEASLGLLMFHTPPCRLAAPRGAAFFVGSPKSPKVLSVITMTAR